MRHPEHPVPTDDRSGPSVAVYSALIVIGMIAPVVTFLIAVSGLAPESKVYGLAATSVVYFGICFWSFKRLRHEAARLRPLDGISSANPDITGRLLALEEANEFFGGSLQPADTFRLVSDRIRDLFDFETSVLFVIDHASGKLRAQLVQGANHHELRNASIESGLGLSGLAVLSGEVEFSANLKEDKAVLPSDSLDGLNSSAAIPVFYKGEAFAVLQLFSSGSLPGDARSRELLAAVGERVGLLLRGSIAAQESLSSALTDSVTNLPNERAFFMILENQLAESIRFREERPLSILTLDIRGTDSLNQEYNGGEAQRLLVFAAEIVRGQLRKMDFLARSGSEEFLVILPTASQSMADEVIKRIRSAFGKATFTTLAGDDARVGMNVGAACFWQDGDNANQLLETARLRRRQAQSQEPQKVVWFPKEYVN